MKNVTLAFLGWLYYVLERLTILYAMFNFIRFLFSLINENSKTSAIQTQVNRQASVARLFFAGFIQIPSTAIRIFFHAKYSEYKKKQHNYDTSSTITFTHLTQQALLIISPTKFLKKNNSTTARNVVPYLIYEPIK